jgi:hypothetical protein
MLGLTFKGNFVSERENVDEDICALGSGVNAVEVDLMQALNADNWSRRRRTWWRHWAEDSAPLTSPPATALPALPALMQNDRSPAAFAVPGRPTADRRTPR